MLSARVERLPAVDRGRIAEFYIGHADDAVRLAYLLTGDHEVAEDLVQDAFVRLAGRLVHLRHPEAFGAYLRTTVVNLSRSYFRRRRVERAHLERAGGMLERETTRGSGVEEREELWRALARLSPRQRAAIVLRFYEDLPESEVADILRCRPGTVKSLVSRGLETLRGDVRGDER
jgi:RNA polymerase sigma-70 factor (sigma-E family)